MKELTALAQQYALLRLGKGNLSRCIDWASERLRLDEDEKIPEVALLSMSSSVEEAMLNIESILESSLGLHRLRECPIDGNALYDRLGIVPLECSFYLEVYAPNGLANLEGYLAGSGIDLYLYHSHFNDKKLLRSKSPVIELDMETSLEDTLHGSGYLYCEFQEAVSLLRKLGRIFESAGYSHKIGVDDERGENTVWIVWGHS